MYFPRLKFEYTEMPMTFESYWWGLDNLYNNLHLHLIHFHLNSTKQHLPSQRVLKNCDFSLFRESKDTSILQPAKKARWPFIQHTQIRTDLLLGRFWTDALLLQWNRCVHTKLPFKVKLQNAFLEEQVGCGWWWLQYKGAISQAQCTNKCVCVLIYGSQSLKQCVCVWYL